MSSPFRTIGASWRGTSCGHRALEAEPVGELAECANELLDLLPRVHCGDLEPEARLALRNERRNRHRHVDAVVVEVGADGVDLHRVRERNLDGRMTGDVRRCD